MGWSEQLREGKKEKQGEIEGYASVIEEENRMRGGESCVHRRQREGGSGRETCTAGG